MSFRFPSADIFCRVIDNFGDAGVCWRLACRLKSLGIAVRFITDRPDVLQLIAPRAAEEAQIAAWDDFAKAAAQPAFQPSELIIETFGCRLPEAYDEAAAKLRAQRLAARQTPPFYFNLDYLSAEDWVEGSHNMVGLHPRLDLPKLWFFPGVTDRTGGVLIEDDYEKRQQAFALQKKDFLLELGADPQRTTVFIFTYPVNDLQTAAAALRQAAANRPLNALLAPGEAGDILEKLLSGAGSELRTVRTPFVAQKDFDKLLWASDTAIIRGEDSFIRAQLAGLPMLWSTYPTEDHAHRVKLDAWLTRFVPKLAPWGLSASYTKLAQDWLEGSAASEDICRFLLEARRYAPGFDVWRTELLERGDLAQHMLERAELGM